MNSAKLVYSCACTSLLLLATLSGCHETSSSVAAVNENKKTIQVKAASDQPANAEPNDLAAPEPPEPAGSGPLVDITFNDVKFEIEKGGDFEMSMLTDKIKQLQGKRIRVRGFMLSSFQNHGLKSFVLLQNVNCPFGGPEAYVYHNMMVDLEGGQTTSYTLSPVTVEGVLSIRAFPPEGKEISIFHIRGEKVY
jgi:hypothetical protein